MAIISRFKGNQDVSCFINIYILIFLCSNVFFERELQTKFKRVELNEGILNKFYQWKVLSMRNFNGYTWTCIILC